MRRDKKMNAESTTKQIKDNLLKVGDVAALLSISPRTVRSWVYRRLIPFLKINGALRFDRKIIEKLIQEASRVHPTNYN